MIRISFLEISLVMAVFWLLGIHHGWMLGRVGRWFA